MVDETLAVVIPAKNEAATIGDAIERTRDAVDDRFDEVRFVVPSSSTDGTEAIAREHGAEVVKDGGRGLGEAMFRGLKRAAAHDPAYIMTVDSDLQFRPEEADRLLERREEADLVLGSRFRDDGVAYRMSLLHRLGNRLLTGFVNRVTGLDLTDAQTGFRLMRPAVAEELRMVGRHTYVQETILDAHQNGFSITEVPVTFEERSAGSSRVVSAIRMYALRTLPVLLHRANLTAYLLNGLALLALLAVPAIAGAAVLRQSIVLGVLAGVLALVALQALFVGMFLDGELP